MRTNKECKGSASPDYLSGFILFCVLFDNRIFQLGVDFIRRIHFILSFLLTGWATIAVQTVCSKTGTAWGATKKNFQGKQNQQEKEGNKQ
jgi:hypothetical protein